MRKSNWRRRGRERKKHMRGKEGKRGFPYMRTRGEKRKKKLSHTHIDDLGERRKKKHEERESERESKILEKGSG